MNTGSSRHRHSDTEASATSSLSGGWSSGGWWGLTRRRAKGRIRGSSGQISHSSPPTHPSSGRRTKKEISCAQIRRRQPGCCILDSANLQLAWNCCLGAIPMDYVSPPPIERKPQPGSPGDWKWTLEAVPQLGERSGQSNHRSPQFTPAQDKSQKKKREF